MASTASIDDDSMDAATSDDRDLVRKACTYMQSSKTVNYLYTLVCLLSKVDDHEVKMLADSYYTRC